MRATLVLLAVLLAACSSAPPPPEGIQDRKNRAADYLKFGRDAFQEAQYDKSLSFYLIAVDMNTAVDYEPGMAAAWNSVATAQDALGHTDEAHAALLRAEALAAVSGDRALVLQVAVNIIQEDLATGKNDDARARLTAVSPFPSTAEGALLEHALGTLEKAVDNSVASLAAFDRALAINNNLKLKQEAASNLYMKASVFAKLSRWDEAATALTQALALDKVMENTMGIGQDLRALGTVASKQGKTQEAYDFYGRAYRLFVAAGLPVQQAKTAELLAPIAAALGKPDEQKRYLDVVTQLSPARK